MKLSRLPLVRTAEGTAGRRVSSRHISTVRVRSCGGARFGDGTCTRLLSSLGADRRAVPRAAPSCFDTHLAWQSQTSGWTDAPCTVSTSLTVRVASPAPHLPLSWSVHSSKNSHTVIRAARNRVDLAVPGKLHRGKCLLHALQRTAALTLHILPTTEHPTRLLFKWVPVRAVSDDQGSELVAAQDTIRRRVRRAVHLPLELEGNMLGGGRPPLIVRLELTILGGSGRWRWRRLARKGRHRLLICTLVTEV
mmetsp:Transcript_18245/g.49031  ORF Transcript_18245/g.49031 Transcript_18245/m.49031 type:complete len:250 (-) Transcript_18245:913-1662(-)